jgi:hypothetical protein
VGEALEAKKLDFRQVHERGFSGHRKNDDALEHRLLAAEIRGSRGKVTKKKSAWKLRGGAGV